MITMADRTLGHTGKIVSWLVFLFLFYSLMVAYVAASGSLITDFIGKRLAIIGITGVGGFLFCLLFGMLLYLGIGAVDWFNRLLMLGLIVSYVSLVAVGASHVDTSLLQHRDWSAMTAVIPAVIVSFGFHNLIPSLTTYFGGQPKPLIWTIVIGSAIPLVIYLVMGMDYFRYCPLAKFQSGIGSR